MVKNQVQAQIIPEKHRAVIFDLDGILTKTQDVHARAWKRMFDEFLKGRVDSEGNPFEPFDEESDYLNYVDGKPRFEGIQSFLESRGISIPFGDLEDPPDRETVCSLGNRKNRMFLKELEEHGVEVFQSTVKLIEQLREKGVKTGIISSSKNCGHILKVTKLEHLFDVKIDGMDAAERKIPGKPKPDVFVQAAKDLGFAPDQGVVVEDAISGVQAGRDGRFDLVIGVDRSGQREALLENGADVVVDDLAEVSIAGEQTRPHALENMGEILDLMEGKEVALFLDYDGTLSPIVKHPDMAVLSDEMKKTLDELTQYFTVAVISGRDRPDVESKMGIDGLFYAGSHGFDIAGPNDRHFENEEGKKFLSTLEEAEKELREKIGHVEGAWVERKKYSVAIHYRQTPESAIPDVEEVVDLVHAHHSKLRKATGKKIFELQPNIEWDKGKALHWLLKLFKLDRDDVLPLYFGDDVTDEDAFRALQGVGLGIAVQDHPHPTAAHYVLQDPEEVRQFFVELMKRKKP